MLCFSSGVMDELSLNLAQRAQRLQQSEEREAAMTARLSALEGSLACNFIFPNVLLVFSIFSAFFFFFEFDIFYYYYNLFCYYYNY
jgi:hypothetical protein